MGDVVEGGDTISDGGGDADETDGRDASEDARSDVDSSGDDSDGSDGDTTADTDDPSDAEPEGGTDDDASDTVAASDLATDAEFTLVGLELEPNERFIELELGVPAEHIAFRAIGTTDDNENVDVSDRVEWIVDDPILGMISEDGTFTTSGFSGSTTPTQSIR